MRSSAGLAPAARISAQAEGGDAGPLHRPGKTMELRYYDREGHPVSQAPWQQPGRGRGRRIAYTDTIRYGRRITVATYWLGTGDAAEPADRFHTDGKIRRSGAPRHSYRRQWGWASLEAARAGHQEIVRWLTRVAAWLAGVTDQIPSPPQVSGGRRPDGLAAPARPR